MAKDKKIKWADITSKYVGESYELGKMDCFSLMIDVLKDMKVDVPVPKYKDIDMDNYKQRWLEKPEETKLMMVEWLKTFADKIESKDMLPGDILILEAKKEQIMFAGLFCGNNRIMSACEEYGVTIYRLEYFNILEAFRCQN